MLLLLPLSTDHVSFALPFLAHLTTSRGTPTHVPLTRTTNPICLPAWLVCFSCALCAVVFLSDQLGIALQELGELDEAASCYEKAIALSPDYVLAHYNLAYVRQDQVNLRLRG